MLKYDDAVPEPSTRLRSAGYSRYALGVLFVVYVFNFIDRSILNILAQSIKEDLHLYDWQIGMMGGLAFAAFYTALGIPIARLADTHNRRNIVAVCLTAWSAMTALCGLAQNFWQLLLARIGVAVGEAGGSPPAHSMISDLFAADRRATALGIYALRYSRRHDDRQSRGRVDQRSARLAHGVRARRVAGCIGRAGAALHGRRTAARLLRRRRAGESIRAAGRLRLQGSVGAQELSLSDDRRWLNALVGYGVGPFIPALFVRVHGMSTGEIGTALFWLGFAGILGTASGGWLADRLGKRDPRWYVWLPGLATLISVPFSIAFYTLPEPALAFWIAAMPSFSVRTISGRLFARARARRAAHARARRVDLLVILNLIGMGLGPLFVGITSDLLNAFGGFDSGEALRWALVSVLVFNVLSTVFYLMAARDLKSDLARSHELG